MPRNPSTPNAFETMNGHQDKLNVNRLTSPVNGIVAFVTYCRSSRAMWVHFAEICKSSRADSEDSNVSKISRDSDSRAG